MTLIFLIERNPFGSSKHYPFYIDFKAGGPNHILSTVKLSQVSLPPEKKPINHAVNALTNFLEKLSLSSEQLAIWYASISNYAYWWTRLKYDWDPNKLIGQDNFLRYVPRTNVLLRIYPQDSAFDLLRTIAASLSCACPLQLSFDSHTYKDFPWEDLSCCLTVVDETEEVFLQRIQKENFRIRLISPCSDELQKMRAESFSSAFYAPVLANGRYELLHYLREITISHNYHRYGNFGAREEEFRKMPT
jgi:RHH-type proline utilization regulon transcriptional repressor/proline dehydrogenase/delta 1-pyrroline-5-carboxylate dehydrogenase